MTDTAPPRPPSARAGGRPTTAAWSFEQNIAAARAYHELHGT